MKAELQLVKELEDQLKSEREDRMASYLDKVFNLQDDMTALISNLSTVK